MAARKPALTTELKNVKAELEKVKKDLESSKSSHKWSQDRAVAAEKELADIHAFLDAVPNPPTDKTGEYGAKISAMTRLSVYLASR